MVTFDDVLPTLVRVCEISAAFASVERWCVVRDLRGRVRVVLEPKPAGLGDNERAALQSALVAALGRYFSPPVWTTRDARESGRLAASVLDQAHAWDAPPVSPDSATGEVGVAHGKWLKWERRLSKQAWLEDGRSSAAWPLVSQRPAIVTFYSVKGGVGRTTALVACAWQLADEGRRVAVIDLDLEAPGLGAAFEVVTARGVLDALVDHVAAGSIDLEGLSAPASALGARVARQIQVFPAGKLGPAYLEKLGRLDYTLSTAPGLTSPIEGALQNLLKLVASQTPPPDYVLLDSRSGLHDLAGLSLHGLAHLDVLFSRASEQAYGGLEMALAVLARRRRSELLIQVVQSMVDPDPEGLSAREEEAEFRERVYQMFSRQVYVEGVYDGDAPAPESEDAPHWPAPLRRNDLLQRATRVSGLREALFASDYRRLVRRLEDACERETPELPE